jgi:hypothetical protein
MKNSIPSTIVFALFVSFSIFASVYSQTIPNVKGSPPYKKVRATLLKYGWVAVKQTEECGYRCADFRKQGWVETQHCADMGALAPCIFIFKNTSGKLLEVMTIGEDPTFSEFR